MQEFLVVGGIQSSLQNTKLNRSRVKHAQRRLWRAMKALEAAVGPDGREYGMDAPTLRACGYGPQLDEYIDAGRAWRALEKS